jgi:hypothetical protein
MVVAAHMYADTIAQGLAEFAGNAVGEFVGAMSVVIFVFSTWNIEWADGGHLR